MSTEALIMLAILAVFTGACVLIFGLGYRIGDLLFFAAAVMPIIWISRLNQYFIMIGESKYILLWAVFALLILAAILFGNRNTKHILRKPSRNVMVTMAVLLSVMLLSSLFSSHGGQDVISGITALMFVILPFLAARAVVQWCRVDEAGIQRAVLSLFMAGGLLGVLSTVTALLPSLLPSMGLGVAYKTYGYSRAYSALGGANGTGMVLLLLYCTAFGQLLAKKRRMIAGVALSLAFIGLLTTLARGALIGLVAATIFLLISQRRDMARRIMIASIVAVILLIPIVYKLNQHYTLERLNITPGGLKDATGGGRTATMISSLHYGMNHIILGGGWGLIYEKPRIRYAYKPGSYGRTFTLDGRFSLTTPHCLPALVLVESGGLGLLALGFFIWAMWKALRPPDPRICPHGAAIVQGFRASILGFLVVSLIQDNLFLTEKVAYCYYLYFFTGLAAATYYRTISHNEQVITANEIIHSNILSASSGG